MAPALVVLLFGVGLDCARYGRQWLARSTQTPSTVEYSRRIVMVSGAFPYVLHQHVGNVLCGCLRIVSHVVGCHVKAVIE